MKRASWERLISSLPPNLSQIAAAKYLGQKATTTRYWMVKLGYKFNDGRSNCWPTKRRKKITRLPVNRVDWDLPNVVIAKRFNVSRERVRQVRDELQLPKIGGRK